MMSDFYQDWLNRSLRVARNTIHGRFLGNYTTAYNTWKRVEGIRVLFQKEMRKRKDGSLAVLDLGCGDALPLYIINDLEKDHRHFKFYGIDISEIDVFFAERLRAVLHVDNFKFLVGRAEDLPFPASSFDIVICTEMIEHVRWAEKCVEEIKRVLKDKGSVIISTPNEGNLLPRLARIFMVSRAESPLQREGKSPSAEGEEHISVRNLKEWKGTFESLGFKVQDVVRHGMIYGGYRYNRHRLLFAGAIVLDWLLDHFPFSENISEGATFRLEKKCPLIFR